MRRRSLLTQNLRMTVARTVRDARRTLGWTQLELGRRSKVSRQMVGLVESGGVSPSFEVTASLFDALGIEANLVVRIPFLADRQAQRDPVHARCSAYVQRRLESRGWLVRREIEVVHGRSHGWIDLLAFDPRTRTLLVIEIKTQLDDLGRIERTLAWYERDAWAAARRLGWRPRRAAGWVLLLATTACDDRIRDNRDAVASAFPSRASDMLVWLMRDGDTEPHRRAIALIDPSSRRRDWLLRCPVDGRRTPAPYRDYADFMAAVRRHA